MPERSSTPDPCLVNPAEPVTTPPIARAAAVLSTVTVPAVVPKATGRLSVELPEAWVASIAPESVTPKPCVLAMVYPVSPMISDAKDPPEMSSLLFRAAPVRPVGKYRESPAPDVGATPPTQLLGSDQLSLGVLAAASAPDHVNVVAGMAVSTTSWPLGPPL